jgi:hypothetical protein
MRQASATVRLLAGLALALALTAAITPFVGSRALAQENGQASITIYTAICPAGFTGDDLFDECFDTPGGNITFLLTVPGTTTPLSATTAADGFTAFEGLTATGQYVLQIDVPGDFVDVVADCSEDGADFPITAGAQFGQYLLNLNPNNDIRCDFYILPEDQGGTAQLTIHNRVCPVEYSGTDYFNDCHGNPANGQDFFVENGVDLNGTTNAAGDVTFSGLAPGTYFVFGGPPGDFILRTAIFCAQAATPGTAFPFDQDDGEAGFSIALAAGDDVVCDFYSVPVNQQGTTPTTAPTTAPTKAPTQGPQATSTVSTLPNTGAGTDGGSGGFWPLAALLAVVGVAAVGLTAARTRLVRTGARARR